MAHILLVDDEPALLNMLSQIMSAAGHSALAVQSGDAAIQELRESPFDLMVSDVRMNPVDGIEVLRIVTGSVIAVEVRCAMLDA